MLVCECGSFHSKLINLFGLEHILQLLLGFIVIKHQTFFIQLLGCLALTQKSGQAFIPQFEWGKDTMIQTRDIFGCEFGFVQKLAHLICDHAVVTQDYQQLCNLPALQFTPEKQSKQF